MRSKLHGAEKEVHKARGRMHTAMTRAKGRVKETQEYQDAIPEKQAELLVEAKEEVIAKLWVTDLLLPMQV